MNTKITFIVLFLLFANSFCFISTDENDSDEEINLEEGIKPSFKTFEDFEDSELDGLWKTMFPDEPFQFKKKETQEEDDLLRAIKNIRNMLGTTIHESTFEDKNGEKVKIHSFCHKDDIMGAYSCSIIKMNPGKFLGSSSSTMTIGPFEEVPTWEKVVQQMQLVKTANEILYQTN